MYKYGFIGAGNMGSALVTALSKSVAPEAIAINDKCEDKVKTLTSDLGVKSDTVENIVNFSNYVVLAVKPQMLPDLLSDQKLRDSLEKNPHAVLVTMAAGTKISTICDLLGKPYPVIRIMPNTPVAVGAGVILTVANEAVTPEEWNTFCEDFSASGLIQRMEKEEFIDVGSVISGCGPAYMYMYMDAMAKAGEALGLDYDTAAALAKATARGSAMLAENATDSLTELRIKVCSPGGSTIEGVKSLQEDDLEKIVSKALGEAYRRTKELAGEA